MAFTILFKNTSMLQSLGKKLKCILVNSIKAVFPKENRENVVSRESDNPKFTQIHSNISNVPVRKIVSWMVLGTLIAVVASCTVSTKELRITSMPTQNTIPTNSNTVPPTKTPTPVTPITEQPSNEYTMEYGDLIEKVHRDGVLFVIVSLVLPVEFQPEAILPSEEAVIDQRAMIKVAQDSLRQELQSQNARVYKTYETTPILAIEVDEAALEILIFSPLVKNIQEDSPLPAN